MKTIEIGEKKIELNIGEFLTVKNMREIFPLQKKFQDGEINEIELTIAMIKKLSNQTDVEEIIDSLSLEEFTIVAEEFAKIIDQKKKSNK